MQHGIDDLVTSITNLWREFGQSDNILLALGVNGGLALAGLVVYAATSGIVSMVALVWAILNLLGIVRWVLRI